MVSGFGLCREGQRLYGSHILARPENLSIANIGVLSLNYFLGGYFIISITYNTHQNPILIIKPPMLH